jgi:hypothetical protein
MLFTLWFYSVAHWLSQPAICTSMFFLVDSNIDSDKFNVLLFRFPICRLHHCSYKDYCPILKGGYPVLDVPTSCSSSWRCCRRLDTTMYCHSCNCTLPAVSQKNFRLFRKWFIRSSSTRYCLSYFHRAPKLIDLKSKDLYFYSGK